MLRVRHRVVSVTIQPLLVVVAAYTALPPAVAGAFQAPPTASVNDPVAFEVVSVRPDPGERGALEPPGLYLRMLPGGRFEAGTTLRRLIVFAYGLRPYQRVQGFERLLDERFAVVARVARGVVVAEGDGQRLVRQVLAERFNLRVRFEDRSETVSILRRVNTERLGPGLRPSALDCSVEVQPVPNLDRSDPFRRCTSTFINSNGRLAIVTPSMSAFADYLSRSEGRAVLDETDLEGPWEIDMTFSPVPSFPGVPAEVFNQWPTLATALRSDLGLKLDTARGVVSELVIEHVEPPSPN